MGTEYRLVKVKTGRAYLLGKPAMREPNVRSRRFWITRLRRYLNAFWPGRHGTREANFLEMQKVFRPSEHAMWLIGSTGPNCEVHILTDRFTRRELKELINIALFQTDNLKEADRLAEEIMIWCHGEPVILIPDNLEVEAIANRIGLKIPKIKIEKSSYRQEQCP